MTARKKDGNDMDVGRSDGGDATARPLCTCRRTVPTDPDTRERDPGCPYHWSASGLPDDLGRVLRDQSIIVPQDQSVFELIAKWQAAPSNTASAGESRVGDDA